jgi:hypothetical protein
MRADRRAVEASASPGGSRTPQGPHRTAFWSPHRNELNEKANANEAQPDAGHDLVSALKPPHVLRHTVKLWAFELQRDRLIEAGLRRSPDEEDHNAQHPKHKADRIEPSSGQGAPSLSTSRMITSE